MSEEAISVFLSYSHHDAEMLAELNKHLASLRRTKKIKTWHDRDIEAGDEWELAIQEQLNTANIIILLISADFIASDYCYCNELQRAIERHDAGEARVIPVILKPCLWDEPGIPFSKLNVLPNRTRAITDWTSQEEAYTNVAKGISYAVKSLRYRRSQDFKADQKHSRRVNEKLSSAADFLPLAIPSYSETFWKERKSPQKIEVLTFLYVLHLYIHRIEHQIKVLIETVRQQCRQKIRKRYSRIRLLSGKEIRVDQLYVDMWLLERPEHKNFNTKENLIKAFDRGKDRLALGKRIQRNPGFEIANSSPRLVILGKPGSGKTTFLRHLSIDWCNGRFQPKQIAVLIELRRIRKKIKNGILSTSLAKRLNLTRK